MQDLIAFAYTKLPSKLTSRTARIATCLISLWAGCLSSVAYSQDMQHLASIYESASKAFAKSEWDKSREGFAEVALLCPHTPLQLQAEYYSIECLRHLGQAQACDIQFRKWLEKVHLAGERGVPVQGLANSLRLRLANDDETAGKIEQAEHAFRSLTASEVDPQTRCAAWTHLGWLWLDKHADALEAQKCFAAAQSCCQTGSSDLSNLFWGQAVASFELGNWSQAEEHLQRMQELNPTDELQVRSQLLLAKMQVASGKAADAVNMIKPLLQSADPSSLQAQVLFELAIALLESGESTDAHQYLLQLTHDHPEHPLAFDAKLRIARQSEVQGDFEEAKRLLDQVCNPQCPARLIGHAHLQRGALRVRQQDGVHAIPDLQIALQTGRGNTSLELVARFYLAESYYLTQRWKEAETHWSWLSEGVNKQSTLPEWSAIVWLRQAEMFANQQRWNQAVEMTRQIQNQFPKFSRSYEVEYLIARSQIASADFESARKTLQRVIDSPTASKTEFVARAWWMTGEVYFLQGDFPRALDSYWRVNSHDQYPEWQAASLLQSAKCYEALENYTEAARLYSEIVTQFPTCPYVTQAQTRLSKLRSSSRQAKLVDRS